MPHCRHSFLQNAAQASALGLRPWCTCSARMPGRSFRRCSSTTESTPPESATAVRLSFRGFLELAIAHQALEARFDELPGLLVRELLERLGERLAQRLRGGLRVAVRAAERLGDRKS